MRFPFALGPLARISLGLMALFVSLVLGLISQRAEMELLAWLREPAVLFYMVLLVGGFVLCFVYLRRVMQSLDFSAAESERVRAAFDTLADGVLVLDPQGRITLANRAFCELHSDGDGEFQGRVVSDLKWMPRHIDDDITSPPWNRVLRG
ncbi:MAG TPA: PAS domain-containing protein, partial [Burkholderiales bacterium]|nr:PAS domain-containing protein [Burkholderiales bacterium]